MSTSISASQAVAVQSAQSRQSAAQVGIKASNQKDQEVVAMLQKAGQELQSVTANRGNRVNLSV